MSFKLKNLDAKDLKILQILDQDVRASYSQIGRKAKISKETVQYRIKRLEEEKIITGYYAFLNVTSPGYKFLIKNKSLSEKNKEDFEKFVTGHTMVTWFANTEGNYDYVISIVPKEDIKLVSFVKEILDKFGSYFRERHLLKIFSAYSTNEKYLFNGKYLYTYEMNLLHPKINPDQTENKLIREISLNSRQSFTDLGKKLNLTPEAISYRFKRVMKNKNIIGLKLRLDYAKLGLNYYHLFISLQDQSIRKKLINYYIMHPDCNALLEEIGLYDMHIEFMLPSERIEEVMDDLRLRFGDKISNYELLNIRKEFKLNILVD